ncbi:MAG TPA: biotin carboxylase N-terminal domain-containing protein, partial [Polyangiaceae bacterium]
MFRKVLIANRGEIAIRVIRACRELGIATVAVHSEADAHALHVRFADQAVCIGPALASESYLNIPAIISAAEITAADAIHPGYGFLSESTQFAQVVEKCGLNFIGPSSEAMGRWGDKLRAREAAMKFGLPLLPGSVALTDAEHAETEATRVGFPVMIKARGGGGGRGMRVVRTVAEVRRAFESATAEATKAFKNSELYLERFVERPRHIEFQALADKHGQVWTLGERECSLQRKNQKLVEESPSPVMTDELRASMGETIRKAIAETGYTSLGTLEFLMDEDGSLYFMEMNTRVQVEHPVTEMVTGVDLVVQQIRAAAGEKLELPDTRPWKFRGHAIECRIMAE